MNKSVKKILLFTFGWILTLVIAFYVITIFERVGKDKNTPDFIK